MFTSWRDFWNFEREVHRERRFRMTESANRFLDAIAATCDSRADNIPIGWRGWRAQLGHDWRHDERAAEEVPCAYSPARMKPLADRAWEGRVNPKGIPSLYLATTPETAMSEVRPWVGSAISLGTFVTTRELRVVNCSRYHDKIPFYLEEPPEDEMEKAAWIQIDRAFSRPATASDERADYAPTQIIAELFKELKFDGLYYKSAFGEQGFNIALFDLDAARLETCILHEVESIDYRFRQSDNPYFVKQPDHK